MDFLKDREETETLRLTIAAKKTVETDTENSKDSLAKEAENVAAQGNIKHLYDTTRKLAENYKPANRLIKDKKGDVLTSDGDLHQLKRWREHFEELLNRPAP